MVLINQDPRGSPGNDRISELPEVLIHFILSFLPTQCAVSTSVLSKHWRYFWKSLPVIDLCELKFPSVVELEGTIEDSTLQDQRLLNFVDRKLSLHYEAQDIKKFRLDTRNGFEPEWKKLKEWFSALFTRHNLEEFVFYAEESPDDVFLPSCGRYASLVILELDTWNQVYLPDAINFPNLKICRLTYAILCMYSEDPTTQFFSSLPVLEELELKDCTWYLNISDQLIISAPSLKYLFISGPTYYTEELLEDVFPIYWFKINIFAPNLLSLRYTDLSAVDFSLHRFESLVDAEIDFERLPTDIPQPQENVPITTRVFKVLSNVVTENPITTPNKKQHKIQEMMNHK